ncbi:hypothetical protein [Alteromonas sp. ASW11-130]|uniref:hypothetical protein n=1 Tax=Alteromonas sp. ASW11-130 TaxID=3015775 RepID=UPI002241E213|nr:hypothetical protein [Alteromonas sp. ASW11-130]MCW8093205.1 hypothetical protein [Alteromonas sp. ASW11-130]
MSSKVNVNEIIRGHYNTLKNASTGKLSLSDWITFVILPLVVAILTVIFGFKQTNEISSLLVNFGAIFTALLLSVLVLVYDQGIKISDKIELKENGNNALLKRKRCLLDELYYNICYSIVISVSLVFFCLIESVARGWSYSFAHGEISMNIQPDVYFLSPFIVFLTLNLMVTILMIVKRMHTLLTSN